MLSRFKGDLSEGMAHACALRLLARRDHSLADLTRKLLLRGFAKSDVEETIKRLSDSGYIDDRRYAERWANAALEGGKGYGPRIRLELQQRGVGPELAAQVTSELTEEYDEAETLRRLTDRKFPDFDPSKASEKERRRVFGFLKRKGFSISVITAFFRETILYDSR